MAGAGELDYSQVISEAEGALNTFFINTPIDKHEGADEEKHFAVEHHPCQVFGSGSYSLLGCMTELLSTFQSCTLGVQQDFCTYKGCGSCSNCTTCLKTCCCMVVCWLETWLQLGAMGMAHVAGQAGLQLLWNMWRPWVRMGLNVSFFFFFFLWVRILCLLLWEGEEAQKEQTCPGLASSPRRNIISSTPSCIQGWGWVRNQQWRPAHLPLDGCCARVCLCTCCLTLFSQWTEADTFKT